MVELKAKIAKITKERLNLNTLRRCLQFVKENSYLILHQILARVNMSI